MKTKIIYISGNEIFNMADIRAAFDEVRVALGLGNDTIMFGVPVDADDALATPANTTNQINTVTEIITTPGIESAPAVATADTVAVIPTIADTAPVAAASDAQTEKTHKTTARRGRARAKAADIVTPVDVSASTMAASDDATVAPIVTTASESDTMADAAPVIPILSVLASKATVADTPHDTIDDATADDVALPDISDDAPVTIDVSDETHENDTTIARTAEIDTQATVTDTTDADDITTDVVAERVTIEDMITDDAPVAPVEKTLEQLLESMTPLREDHGNADASMDMQDDAFDQPDNDFEIPQTDNDTDATLTQLATEFAQNEDKIIGISKPESHGKIGKLKNILPFKKVKRDDTGLMGDLFGWAGIAANDEDFSIPGFFTTAASKK